MWTGYRKSMGLLAEQSFGEYKDVFHCDYLFPPPLPPVLGICIFIFSVLNVNGSWGEPHSSFYTLAGAEHQQYYSCVFH